MNSLELSVLCNNTIRDLALELLPQVREALKDFEGQLIKQDCTLTKRAGEALPTFNRKWTGDTGTHYSVNSWYNCTQHSVWFKIKLCVNGETDSKSFCRYHSIEPFMATIVDQKVNKVNEAISIPSKITVKGQKEAIDAYKQAQEVLSFLKGKIAHVVRDSEYIR